MSGKCFVDTNVLMYAQDVSSGFKHERALALVTELWQDGTGVLSTQVLQELCVNLRRRTARPPDLATVRGLLRDYLAWEVVVNTGDSVLRALDLEERYRISFWDALILEAADTAGASILYSEDLSDGQMYGSVQVTNPFTASC